jgi:hypothetical protein
MSRVRRGIEFDNCAQIVRRELCNGDERLSSSKSAHSRVLTPKVALIICIDMSDPIDGLLLVQVIAMSAHCLH